MAKWLNKQRQAISEKLGMGDVTKTEFEPSFLELEKQTDATKKVVEALIEKIPSFLHPDPTERASLSMKGFASKIQKSAMDSRYQHTTGEMAEVMLTGAKELDEESSFGQALMEVGSVFTTIHDAQHIYDNEVNNFFLEPLKALVNQDIKEIMRHRKKLEGRRLDLDFKTNQKLKGNPPPPEEMKISKAKVEESKLNYEASMVNVLDKEVDQVAQLSAFVEASLKFAKLSCELLQACSSSLEHKLSISGDRSKHESTRPTKTSSTKDEARDASFTSSPPASKVTAAAATSANVPSARALFDFEAENEGELSFSENAIIHVKSRIDENWLEGEFRGKTGIFPSNYVEIIVDL